jgi:hypothetical protein
VVSTEDDVTCDRDPTPSAPNRNSPMRKPETLSLVKYSKIAQEQPQVGVIE